MDPASSGSAATSPSSLAYQTASVNGPQRDAALRCALALRTSHPVSHPPAPARGTQAWFPLVSSTRVSTLISCFASATRTACGLGSTAPEMPALCSLKMRASGPARGIPLRACAQPASAPHRRSLLARISPCFSLHLLQNPRPSASGLTYPFLAPPTTMPTAPQSLATSSPLKQLRPS